MRQTSDELLNFTADEARKLVIHSTMGFVVNILSTIRERAIQGRTVLQIRAFNNLHQEILVRELSKLGYTVFVGQDRQLSIHWG